MITQTKFRAGKYMYPATMCIDHDFIRISFPFNRTILTEIKAMDGAKWDPEKKIWSIKNCQRNLFQLAFLQGGNPYERYDLPYIDHTTNRPVYNHQHEMIVHGLTRHYCVFACEMGTGKTLAAIEIMEYVNQMPDHGEFWYVGPRSGIRAVELELLKWKSKVLPHMITYEQLVKEMRTWQSGKKAPQVVIFDESSKIKTPTAQRSQAALALAEGVRNDWNDNGYVILMSGTPAPKTPVDWWNQLEVACPGFIKEGNIHKFRARLALIEERENLVTGGKYPHIVGWRDREDRCDKCGLLRDDGNATHHTTKCMDPEYHPFTACKNEVAYLYERMKGLVLVKFKKDCLDLPEKQYRIVTIRPSVDLLRVAKMIKETGSRAIEVLTLLRELSDGFQYGEEKTGIDITCPRCHGNKTVMVKSPKVIDTQGPNTGEIEYTDQEIQCDNCNGLGLVAQYTRTVDTIECPKDDQLRLDLDAHEECGRIIVWGGFTGTVDRLVEICKSEGWCVLRVDGRGYLGQSEKGEILSDQELLMAMDGGHPEKEKYMEKYPKLAFVGHPKAGGMALTLNASPTEIFYSNDFSGEARMQAEDRFHRPGMDKNRGATIIDYIHLPTDQYVLDNLKKKKDLQKISMGELDAIFKEA